MTVFVAKYVGIFSAHDGNFCVFSVENCNRLLDANGVHWLCSRLMDYDPSRRLLYCSVEILWNVLEKCSNCERLSAQLNDIHCIRLVSISSMHFSKFVTFTL